MASILNHRVNVIKPVDMVEGSQKVYWKVIFEMKFVKWSSPNEVSPNEVRQMNFRQIKKKFRQKRKKKKF